MHLDLAVQADNINNCGSCIALLSGELFVGAEIDISAWSKMDFSE